MGCIEESEVVLFRLTVHVCTISDTKMSTPVSHNTCERTGGALPSHQLQSNTCMHWIHTGYQRSKALTFWTSIVIEIERSHEEQAPLSGSLCDLIIDARNNARDGDEDCRILTLEYLQSTFHVLLWYVDEYNNIRLEIDSGCRITNLRDFGRFEAVDYFEL